MLSLLARSTTHPQPPCSALRTPSNGNSSRYLSARQYSRGYRTEKSVDAHFETTTTEPAPESPPKRPLQPFVLFVKERYGKANGQFLKDGVSVWREMSPAEQQPYKDARKAQMPRYEERLAAYNAAHGLSTPRRTIPGWMIFRMRTGLNGKELGEVWNSMTEAEKKPWRDESQAMKTEYKIRKLEHKMALDAGVLDRGVEGKGQEKWASVREKATTLKHIRVREKLTSQELPPTRPANAFVQFMCHDGICPRHASSVWAEMSAEEKKPYYDIYKAKYARFIQAQNAFIANAKPETLKSLSHLRKLNSANRRNDLNVPGEFIIFTNQRYADGSGIGLSGRARTRESSKIWHAMSDEEKAPYVEAANKLRMERYEKAGANRTKTKVASAV